MTDSAFGISSSKLQASPKVNAAAPLKLPEPSFVLYFALFENIYTSAPVKSTSGVGVGVVVAVGVAVGVGVGSAVGSAAGVVVGSAVGVAEGAADSSGAVEASGEGLASVVAAGLAG